MATHAAPHRPQLRLTRRGRVVVLAFFVLLASLASAVLFTTASHADSPRAAAFRADCPRAAAFRADSPRAGQTFDLADPVRSGRSGTPR
ncbi:MAG: hypothetical protein QOH97_1372 [Actinoplanes sp.]|jgi:hypothetical protein|nr:hypothetical protein [Actinoplanes sp.]